MHHVDQSRLQDRASRAAKSSRVQGRRRCCQWDWPRLFALLTLLPALLVAMSPAGVLPAAAQVYQVPPAGGPQPDAVPPPAGGENAKAGAEATGAAPPPVAPLDLSMPPERVEADVSTRSVAVTSAFTGTEIIVFGAIGNSRQRDDGEPIYDLVVILEGTVAPLIVRRKSRMAGIWINTRSARFERIPSYYAISATREIRQIAARRVLRDNQIGFSHIQMDLSPREEKRIGPNELAELRRAVIRIKQDEGLYKQDPGGVEFIGNSLFRASVKLPANVPVGPLTTRVFLFRNGRLLHGFSANVPMQREGIERVLHSFAFEQPFFYGVFAVLLAVAAGLAASAVFSRQRS